MLLVQLLSFDRLHEAQELRRFVSFCFGIAAAAALLLVTGLLLVLWSESGPAYYLRNPIFYIKLALFAAMVLVAITPARIIAQFIAQWQRAPDVQPNPALLGLLRRYVIVELILFVLVPLAASLSARGIGLPASSS